MGQRTTYLTVGLMMLVLGIGLAIAMAPIYGVALGLMGLVCLAYALTQGEGGDDQKPGPGR